MKVPNIHNICAIRNNILSLPDTIQFVNGNQIVHRYDAMGRKLQTTYYRKRVQGSVTDYIISAEYYNENICYTRPTWNNGRYLHRVNNPEGCMWYLASNGEHYPIYHVRDYQGTIRETYIIPEGVSAQILQRLQYYPSGLRWKENIGLQEDQPYRYNGKEWVDAFGLDEYDSQARWYYPAIARATAMDPYCEDYPDVSPYAWCNNNPVRFVDPSGAFVEVTLSSDSMYNVQNGFPDQDKNIYLVDDKGNRTGDVVGTMFSRYSFFDNQNNVVKGAVINLNDQSGSDFLEDFIKNEPSIYDYVLGDNSVNGKNGGHYDFKSKGMPNEYARHPDQYSQEISLYHNRGMQFSMNGQNVIGTARDIGNYAAGYLAGVNGLPYLLTRLAFDFFQGSREPAVSRSAQNIGYFSGNYYYLKNFSAYVK